MGVPRRHIYLSLKFPPGLLLTRPYYCSQLLLSLIVGRSLRLSDGVSPPGSLECSSQAYALSPFPGNVILPSVHRTAPACPAALWHRQITAPPFVLAECIRRRIRIRP